MAEPIPYAMPWRCDAIIKRSRVLTWAEKAVWMEERQLDLGPEGAWISDANLGERLNLTENTVRQTRSRLSLLGLRLRIARPGCRLPGARPVLPDKCIPGKRPSVKELATLAVLLDGDLRESAATSVPIEP